MVYDVALKKMHINYAALMKLKCKIYRHIATYYDNLE